MGNPITDQRPNQPQNQVGIHCTKLLSVYQIPPECQSNGEVVHTTTSAGAVESAIRLSAVCAGDDPLKRLFELARRLSEIPGLDLADKKALREIAREWNS